MSQNQKASLGKLCARAHLRRPLCSQKMAFLQPSMVRTQQIGVLVWCEPLSGSCCCLHSYSVTWPRLRSRCHYPAAAWRTGCCPSLEVEGGRVAVFRSVANSTTSSLLRLSIDLAVESIHFLAELTRFSSRPGGLPWSAGSLPVVVILMIDLLPPRGRITC